MPSQHTTEETAAQEGGFVPLDLPELHILSQEWQVGGTLRIEVIATTTQVACPHCQKMWFMRTFDTGGEVQNPSSAAGCITFLKGDVRV